MVLCNCTNVSIATTDVTPRSLYPRRVPRVCNSNHTPSTTQRHTLWKGTIACGDKYCPQRVHLLWLISETIHFPGSIMHFYNYTRYILLNTRRTYAAYLLWPLRGRRYIIDYIEGFIKDIQRPSCPPGMTCINRYLFPLLVAYSFPMFQGPYIEKVWFLVVKFWSRAVRNAEVSDYAERKAFLYGALWGSVAHQTNPNFFLAVEKFIVSCRNDFAILWYLPKKQRVAFFRYKSTFEKLPLLGQRKQTTIYSYSSEGLRDSTT